METHPVFQLVNKFSERVIAMETRDAPENDHRDDGKPDRKPVHVRCARSLCGRKEAALRAFTDNAV